MTRIDVPTLRRRLDKRVPHAVEGEDLAWAAVALVLRDMPGGTEVLCIRRAERRGDLWSGQIAFPGGRRNRDDPSLLITAVRETQEELAIVLEPDRELLGQLDDVAPRTPTQPPVAVRPFVFHVTRPVRLRYSSEVADSFWVPLSTLREPSVRQLAEITIRGRTSHFPAYVVGDSVIWGLTERILTGFLVLIP